MGCRSAVVYDEGLTRYDFGPGHPMAPVRVELTMRLAEALGLLDRPGLQVSPAPSADDALLETVHTADYVAAVRRMSSDPWQQDLEHGLGTADDPVFAGMHEAAAHIVGASVEAARLVWSGEVEHAVNLAGGLHHAMPASASGFCIYNDPAIAIRWLLRQGLERIAYVDIDAHHGDGVQTVFYDDPRVLTISLHESPRTLFPGTGFGTESGGELAPGSAANVALPPDTGDAGWLRAFHAVVPELLRAFDPQVLVSQHGCDSHAADPLTHLMVSVDGQRAAHIALHDLAHELCEGRWVCTGGGGYAIVDVVPRSWAHLVAAVSGSPLDPSTPIPQGWLRAATEVSGGRRPPSVMTDGSDARYTDWSTGFDPGSWLDRSIAETRRTVFPWHGIHVDQG